MDLDGLVRCVDEALRAAEDALERFRRGDVEGFMDAAFSFFDAYERCAWRLCQLYWSLLEDWSLRAEPLEPRGVAYAVMQLKTRLEAFRDLVRRYGDQPEMLMDLLGGLVNCVLVIGAKSLLEKREDCYSADRI